MLVLVLILVLILVLLLMLLLLTLAALVVVLVLLLLLRMMARTLKQMPSWNHQIKSKWRPCSDGGPVWTRRHRHPPLPPQM